MVVMMNKYCWVILILELALCYKFDQEFKAFLKKVCEEANAEIQKNGFLHRPQIRQVEFYDVLEKTCPRSSLSFHDTLPYILCDPLNQFPTLFKKAGVTKILCPLCLRNKQIQYIKDTPSWKNGKTPRLNPRIIYGIRSPIALISKLYCCFGGHKEIVACDPDILKQLPDAYIDFYTSHKSGVTKELLQLCEQLLDKGLSLNSIAELSKQRYEQTYEENKLRFWLDTHPKKGSLLKVSKQKYLEGMSWPVPSANLLSAAILSRFEKDEKAFRGLFTSLSAEWLACDHTYKSVANVGYFRTTDGRWIKKFKGIFVITNEKGQPVQWKFTKTEQFEEVRNIFNQLAERFQTQGKTLSGIFTDTCCKWAGKLNDIFPGVPVKLDLFHAVQRFTSTIPKRAKYHAKILRAYALVFRDPKDLGEQRALETPKPEVLIDNLKKFQREWKDVTDGNGHLALNTNATREMKNIKVHILKGCLSGIPPGCGTNRNERLNKHLNDFLSSNKIGISLAYARCFRLFAELSSMKKMTTEYFTSYNWQNELGNEHHCDNNSKESKERLESFGIENEAYREKEECYKKWNINIVEDEKIQAVDNYIKSLLADCDSALQSLPCHSYVLSEREETKRKLNILHNSICLWRSANYLQNIFGKKIVQHQSLIQDSRPVKTNWGEEEERESVESTRETNPSKVQELANAFGFKVLEIEGDGNCFFSAVAAQIQKLLENHDVSTSLINYFHMLGIHCDASTKDMVRLLRRLIVQEWTGPFIEDYQPFFVGVDVQEEARNFLENGHFSSSLGDSMPLAMANVLQIPITILAPHYLTPFISVFPRCHVDCIPPLMLAYENSGPGHYDALVPVKENDKANTATACQGVNQLGSRNTSRLSFCRCGINVKSRGTLRRVYKSRCKCMSLKGECSSNCKCQGECGGVKCKNDNTTPKKSTKNQRMSWKRGSHPITSSPTKKPIEKKATTGSLNALEFFVLFSIVKYAISKDLCFNCEQISNLYNEIADLLLQHDTLMFLPIETHSQGELEHSIRLVNKNQRNDV